MMVFDRAVRLLAVSVLALSMVGCEDDVASTDTSTLDTLATTSTPKPSTSSSSSSTSSGGFIWKPVSEGDGKLVVLLPAQYRGKVSSCWIADSGGSVIEQGNFAGDTHNGARPHYRFSKPGSGYGQNIQVIAATSDGNVSWQIPNGASRVDA